eukprot:comp22504_c0_seq1/m.56184 comp22504_c0_seq1/g.56184  ORF comp22504_c0_seq1/g.56184 comp22504_c0_seq1/m.56184 type:complete len:324 (+) comp22504_c0_seq1:4716-5687(+)
MEEMFDRCDQVDELVEALVAVHEADKRAGEALHNVPEAVVVLAVLVEQQGIGLRAGHGICLLCGGGASELNVEVDGKARKENVGQSVPVVLVGELFRRDRTLHKRDPGGIPVLRAHNPRPHTEESWEPGDVCWAAVVVGDGHEQCKSSSAQEALGVLLTEHSLELCGDFARGGWGKEAAGDSDERDDGRGMGLALVVAPHGIGGDAQEGVPERAPFEHEIVGNELFLAEQMDRDIGGAAARIPGCVLVDGDRKAHFCDFGAQTDVADVVAKLGLGRADDPRVKVEGDIVVERRCIEELCLQNVLELGAFRLNVAARCRPRPVE